MSEPFTPQFPPVIDSTQLNDYRACPHLWYEKYCRGLGFGSNIHLHFGGAFAAGVESARRSFYERSETPSKALNEGVRAIMLYWGSRPYTEPDGRGGEHVKSFSNCCLALQSYLEVYPLDNDTITPLTAADSPNHACEWTGGVPLDILHPTTGDPIIFGGRFDMLGLTITRLLAIVDEKTTGSIGTQWADTWKMRGQFLGYIWLLNQYDYDPDIVVVRGIAIQRTQFKHAEATLTYPNWQVERWREEMFRTIRGMVSDWEAHITGGAEQGRGFAYNFGSACTSYGLCEQTMRCTSRNPEGYLGEYTLRRWNPLTKSTLEETTDGRDS